MTEMIRNRQLARHWRAVKLNLGNDEQMNGYPSESGWGMFSHSFGRDAQPVGHNEFITYLIHIYILRIFLFLRYLYNKFLIALKYNVARGDQY